VSYTGRTPSCSLIPALPPSSRSCHPLGRYGSNGARTRSSSTALPAGILTPQGDHHPAPAEQVRTVPAQRPGAGAPRRQARRPRISRHRPASMGQAHGSKAAQVPHGLPALPRPDPCRTATSRNPSHGINHQRAGCREIWHVRFGGGRAEKDPRTAGTSPYGLPNPRAAACREHGSLPRSRLALSPGECAPGLSAISRAAAWSFMPSWGWLSGPAEGRAPARWGFPSLSPGPTRERPGNRRS
jgi:hypothetical protein